MGPSVQNIATPPNPRIASIDVLRGLTILTMIFVNDVAGLRDVPAWLKHMPSDQDGMTIVDVVFPAFLFIVGMAVPLAIGRRLDRGESRVHVAAHVLVRTLGLLVLGVFMVNMHGLNAAATGMSSAGWTLLVFLAVVLVWNRYPQSAGARRTVFLALRGLGVAMLVYLAAIYRGGDGEGVTWMRTSWWGILGLIGWAYLTACVAYVAFHRQLAGLIGVLGLLILLYVGDKTGALRFAGIVREYVWLGGHIGGHSAIAVAGAITATLILDRSPAIGTARRIARILLFAAGLFAAGFLLRPLYGISKVQATPTWCLYSSGMCCGLYAVLYWLVDVRRHVRWSAFLTPAGSNPLLAYILPDIVYAALGVTGITCLSTHLSAGAVGIARSAIFAGVMLGLTAVLSRLHVRLHL